MTAASRGVQKLKTWIPGFDLISNGGIPQDRSTLVTGSPGSGKTIFAVQFLVSGIQHGDEPGVFVTFEDSPEDIRKNTLSFGWDLAKWEEEGKLAFVDASLSDAGDSQITGQFDLGGLLARIKNAIRKTGAKRVSLDSINALFVQLDADAVMRSELMRIFGSLKEMGVTIIFTAERTQEYGPVTRWGIEAFVADNVIILRNLLFEERRRRTIEILKYRGTVHQRGEYPFTIWHDEGIIVIPLSASELTQSSSTTRVTSGVEALDSMCNGGFFRDSIVLVSGATGTGKTLLVTEFMAGGIENNERSLLFAFEESRDQLFRNAEAWGIDFRGMERDEKLKVVNIYPHAMALEDHFVEIRKTVEAFNPNRVAVDSLSALERTAYPRAFREFVISLTSLLKKRETAGLFTSTTPSLLGGESITERHISTLTDSIILLRYLESYGEMRRGITVLKMRGSMHEKTIRGYTIDGQGMHIGEPLTNVTGVLSGQVTMRPQETPEFGE